MPIQAQNPNECVVDRRRKRRRLSERTTGPKNRIKDVAKATAPAAKSPASEDGADEDRRKVERRRQIDPTTCERDYASDEIEFMTAMDDYKRRSGRMFPTWSEVLEVLRDLGYRKVAEQTQTYTGEE